MMCASRLQNACFLSSTLILLLYVLPVPIASISFIMFVAQLGFLPAEEAKKATARAERVIATILIFCM